LQRLKKFKTKWYRDHVDHYYHL